MILVPDTSVIVDGRITKLVKRKEYRGSKVLIPEVVVAELEHQANMGRESGFKGIDELNLLRKAGETGKIDLEYVGRRPKTFRDNDNIIRNTAKEYNATLVTGDRIQAAVARSKGIEVIYLAGKKIKKTLKITQFFDPETMSVHLRDRVPPMAKKGKPGRIKLVRLSEKPSTEKELEDIAREIIAYAKVDPDSFIEIERKGATVVQLAQLRIAIAKPPFSDGYEITAVRPIANVTLDDYRLSKRLTRRLKERAEGILVAGPPGAGKSTFSQALAEFYKDQGRVVKTMESPRDLQVSDEITQYAPLEGDMEKTADILLLVRPDYTIYDEVRKTKDFKIFADMRLSGVGMIGVVHAAKGIDAIQRLIGRVELGMIPQIVDTTVFIKDGEIEKVYKVSFTVKVPGGMVESDLARPVIEVRDFETGKAEYEIYTFGEETIVMPVMDAEKSEGKGTRRDARDAGPVERLALERIAQEIRKFAPESRIEIGESKATIWVDERYIPNIIGKKGKRIEKLERKLGIGIDVRPFRDRVLKESIRDIRENYIDIKIEETGNYLHLVFGKELSGKVVEVLGDGEFLFTATIGRKGEIKVGRKTNIGQQILDILSVEGEISARGI